MAMRRIASLCALCHCSMSVFLRLLLALASRLAQVPREPIELRHPACLARTCGAVVLAPGLDLTRICLYL